MLNVPCNSDFNDTAVCSQKKGWRNSSVFGKYFHKLWFQFGLQGRLSVLLLTLVAASAVIGAYGLWTFRDAVTYVEIERLHAGVSLTQQVINDLAERNLAVASLVSVQPQIIEAVRNRDRAALLAAATPAFELVKARFGIDNMHFHTPETVTILRMHQPTMFGDDLSNLRPMIVAVNQSRQPRSGLELGVNGLPVRGAVPIRLGDVHLGVVEVGAFVTDHALQRVAPHDMTLTIFLARPSSNALRQLAPTAMSVVRFFKRPDNMLERVAGSSASAAVLSEDQLRAGMFGNGIVVYLAPQPGNPTSRLAEAFPLRDWEGAAIGVVQVEVDMDSTGQKFQELIVKFGFSLLALLSIAASLAWIFGRRLVHSLRDIRQALSVLAGGSTPLLPQTALDRTDEIGDLARAAETFRRVQGRQALLLRELDHRVKNMLAIVQSLMVQTFRSTTGDPKRFQQDFNGRIMALARAHDMVFRAGPNSVGLDSTVRMALSPWLDLKDSQIRIPANFPHVPLTPAQTQALTLGFHELATNAAKYGALSTPGGFVGVSCSLDSSGVVSLIWSETGGPALSLPLTYRGVGMRLLERGLAQDLGPGSNVALKFDRMGVQAVIRFIPVAAGDPGP